MYLKAPSSVGGNAGAVFLLRAASGDKAKE